MTIVTWHVGWYIRPWYFKAGRFGVVARWRRHGVTVGL
jgi:hypothetical protein